MTTEASKMQQTSTDEAIRQFETQAINFAYRFREGCIWLDAYVTVCANSLCQSA